MRPANGAEFAVRMNFEPQPDGGFRAFSRERAAGEMVSWHRALLGRLTRRLPERGSLARIDNGRLTRAGGAVELRGRLVSPILGNRWLRGTMQDGRFVADMHVDTTAARTGTIEATPATGGAPLRDYAALGPRIERQFHDAFFDPVILREPAWRGFFAELTRRLGSARDDLDVMTAFYALRPRLPVSHIELYRHPELATLSGDSLLAMYNKTDPEQQVLLSFPAPGVALLRVLRWHAVTPVVDRAFARIDSAAPHTLILDIRGNPGGDVSSMAPASHLLRDTTVVGVFLGRKWFLEHRAPPAGEQLLQLPRVTEEAGVSTILGGVHEHGVLVGMLPPRSPRFDGQVFLLMDGNSGSASEPLAHLLKVTRRATLVGQRTAGAMLSGPPHPVGDGWILVLPVADYYAADGTRLEGRGVLPDIAVRSDSAFVVVAERVRARDPYAGALLLGSGHAAANRQAEAERWLREARRLAPDSMAALRDLGLLYIQQQRWSEAFAALDSVLAREPRNPSAVYQLGRAAAISGQRLADGQAALSTYLTMPHQSGLPTHAGAHWRRGQIRRTMGDIEGARADFREAVRLSPDEPNYAAELRSVGG